MTLTQEQILAALQKAGAPAVRTALNSFNFDQLPAPMAAMMKEFKGKLDANLAALPPTDQVPASLDAAGMLHYTCNRLADFDQFLSQLMAGMPGMVTACHSAADARLDARVAEALAAKVAAGEFVPKDAAATALNSAVAAAREDGVADGLARAAKHSARAEQLKAANLPAAEAVLALADDAFATALQTATERQTKAAALVLTGAPMEFAWDFFAPAEAWAAQLAANTTAHAAAEKAVAGAKTATQSAPAAKRPDPFQGGGAPAAGWAGVKPM